MKLNNGTLKSWWYDEDHNVIWGFIYGDTKKRFKNGQYIHTSSLETKPPFKKGDKVETLNSVYILGGKLGRPSVSRHLILSIS